MTTALFLSMLSYLLVTAYTPGPNNLILLQSAVNQGIKGSKGVRTGIMSGFIVIILLGMLLTYTASTIVPVFVSYFKYVGVAYILYLAYKILRSKANGTVQKVFAFRDGFLLQFMNIKIILYSITSFSLFVLPVYDDLLHMFYFAMLMILVSMSALYTWTYMGHFLEKGIKKYQTVFNIIMALLLLQSAYHLIF